MRQNSHLHTLAHCDRLTMARKCVQPRIQSSASRSRPADQSLVCSGDASIGRVHNTFQADEHVLVTIYIHCFVSAVHSALQGTWWCMQQTTDATQAPAPRLVKPSEIRLFQEATRSKSWVRRKERTIIFGRIGHVKQWLGFCCAGTNARWSPLSKL